MAGLYRRGSNWWGRAQRNGKEYRRSLGTSNKADAESRLRRWLNDLDALAWGEAIPRLFDDAAIRFIDEHLTTLKPSSAQRYYLSLRTLSRLMEGKHLHEIGTALLSEFETIRRSDGVSPSTIRRDLACLSSMLTSAVDWEWLDQNPVPAFMRRRRKRGLREAEPRRRYLSHDEESSLLAVATPLSRSVIEFAIDTGLRSEEQFSLTWSQVDMATGIIRLGSNTKSGRSREVPILPRSAQILAQLPRHIRSPYVWCHSDGKRFMRMNKGLKRAAERAEIQSLRWHDLRRTCGCRLLQDYSRTMEQVAMILGHHSITVTEKTYAFLRTEDLARNLSFRTIPGTGNTDD